MERHEAHGGPPRGKRTLESFLVIEHIPTSRLGVFGQVAVVFGALSIIAMAVNALVASNWTEASPIWRMLLECYRMELVTDLARVSLAIAVVCVVLEWLVWLTVPPKVVVKRDFMRAAFDAGLFPPDLRNDELRMKVRMRRLKRRAHIVFSVRRAGYEYESLLRRVRGLRPAFRRATAVVPDRARDPFEMVLTVIYGGEDAR